MPRASHPELIEGYGAGYMFPSQSLRQAQTDHALFLEEVDS